ncbi:hypothetical protein SEUCBS139899_009430 [Sporothrix eucalyptigena]
MDPQRIPPAYWADRLAKARAMGLNTVFSYVYWNLLEPKQGIWDNSGGNNISHFFSLAATAGLHVVLRPGPYICGEREWGGFPAWLTQVKGLQTVRSHDPAFLAAATSYLERLAADLRNTTAPNGGALVMVQVENEYGSYGKDHQYTAALRDTLRASFPGVVLYTNDGGVDWTLAGGSVPGVLAATDGDPRGGFNARRLYVTDRSMQGPLLDGEYYTLAPDFWGTTQPHNVPTDGQTATFLRDLDYVLSGGNSISLYMFHGGTNFGLSNGALYRNTNVTAPFTTSYDYGAPLDESGRTTALYTQLRRAILRRLLAAERAAVPAPPANIPHMALPAVTLTPYSSLFASAPDNSTEAASPVTMEALGQAYGLVLYEHIYNGTSPIKGVLHPGDRARDRVLVYVNGVRVGVIDSTYERPATVTVSLKPGDHLQLLVENLGRVDYFSQEATTANMLLDPYKGIRGDVTVGGTVLHGWESKGYPLESTPTANTSTPSGSGPLFYRGTFLVDAPTDGDLSRLDTFLAVPAGVKGVVWVNGFCLGRYWVIGPQQSLHLPGPVLRTGANLTNEVVVLELEPETVVSAKTTFTAIGLADRVWANHPDPDAP